MSSGDRERLVLELAVWPVTENVNILHFNEVIIKTQNVFIFSKTE